MKLRSLSILVASIAVALVIMTAHAEPLRQSDVCRQGYVWREAFPGDHVCVTPATRSQAAYDNSQAGVRTDPGGAYGPNTCRSGYVWRAARPDDLVCVTPETRTQAAADNLQAAARVAGAATQDHTYNQPRWGDARLDWCETWGANCGKPAALAFCHQRRYEDVVVFRAEVVGKAGQTRTLRDNQVCSGQSFCTAFAYITCTGPISATANPQRIWPNPTWKGNRLDACLQWGTNCGKPAADAFCRTKGFSGSLDSFVDAAPGGVPTRLIGTDQVCTGSGCRGFQQIICK